MPEDHTTYYQFGGIYIWNNDRCITKIISCDFSSVGYFLWY